MTVSRKRLECTIVLTLIFVLCYAVISEASQRTLAEDIVRLRVVANSDSVEDQRIKLQVRDAVLREISAWAESADSAPDMLALLEQHRKDIARTVSQTLRQNGRAETFTIRLDQDYYPTRQYDTFSLPAGEYQGLRIFLGNARGHNWWCVLYPSLCLDASGAEEQLTEEERGLIYQNNSEYAIRFRTAEALGELKALLHE